MPVKAGVSDTAHYKGKVFGFCAKECKEEFLKNPASYLETATLYGWTQTHIVDDGVEGRTYNRGFAKIRSDGS